MRLVNEEQRQGLEELATWRASLRSGTVNGDDAEPGTVAAAGPATPVAVVDRETSNGEVTETELRADPDTVNDTDTDDTDIENRDTAATVEETDSAAVSEPDTAGDRTEVAETEDEEDEEDETPRRRPLVDWLVVMGIALLAALLDQDVRARPLRRRRHLHGHDARGRRPRVRQQALVPAARSTSRRRRRTARDRRHGVARPHQARIGLPGESIEMRNCQVFVGDRLLIEPYLDPEVVRPGNCGEDFEPLDIEDGRVFVMGDNRWLMDGELGTVDRTICRPGVRRWPSSNWAGQVSTDRAPFRAVADGCCGRSMSSSHWRTPSSARQHSCALL
ncbi:MAG: S26 family signal peptidase [Ilumatobacteraceae bacterium]